MATEGLLKHVDTEVGRGMDDAVDSLKWCKRHRHERNETRGMSLPDVVAFAKSKKDVDDVEEEAFGIW